MESLAVLVSALFLAGLVLFAWRARALAVHELRRAKAASARERELEAITADGANLLYATVLSVEHARVVLDAGTEADPDEALIALDEAHQAVQALASLFTAARAYARGDSDVAVRRAEGCVRVAVAIARSRGLRVALLGVETQLLVRGDALAACELVVALLDAARATLEVDEHVQVTLGESEVRVRGGSKTTLDAAALIAAAAAVGFSVEGRGRNQLVIRAVGEPAPETAGRGAMSTEGQQV